MRLRRYKVTVTNSDGVIDTSYFFTSGAAIRHCLGWRRRLLILYAYYGLLDPYAFFVIKKWLPNEKAWDFFYLDGGPTYIEDLYRSVK